MKKIILLFILSPLLAFAEGSFLYIHDDKVYKIVSLGDNEFRLYGMDQSGKEERRLFSDGKTGAYSKERLLAMYKEASGKSSYYKFGTETPEVLSEKNFEKNIESIALKDSGPKLPGNAEENDTSCNQIAACKDRGGLDAYTCLYRELKKRENDNEVNCKNRIQSLSKVYFKQITSHCNQEAIALCNGKQTYDLYQCLWPIKNQTNVPNICKNAVSKTQANLDRLTAVNFPYKQAAQVDYGKFKARPIKTGFSPASSDLRRSAFPRNGIK